jgi:hypothetical protein
MGTFQKDLPNSTGENKAVPANLFGWVGVHWDQAGLERRQMYLAALQLDRPTDNLATLAFDDFDHLSQHALLGAVVRRCPELFKHFVSWGYI